MAATRLAWRMKHALALMLLVPITVAAQPADVQLCAGCHGANGEGDVQIGAPRIAGQLPSYFERQLAAFADGRRHSERMTPVAQQLTADQRAALAAYYAAKDVPPLMAAPPVIPGNARDESWRAQPGTR
jgi:cytochrome c553